MAQVRKQMDRRWLWLGAIILLIVVFFAVRSLTREHLQVRVAQATREPLASTESTNGRVEPDKNYEVHSPIATTVKAVFVHPGDQVKPGQLLIVLDDVQAQARVAAAQSGVSNAQAALDAILKNGTLEQRQASAAEIARDRMDRDQAARDLDALSKLNATGAASASEVASAHQRLEAAQQALTAAEAGAKSRYSEPDVARARAALADAQAGLIAAQQVEAQTSARAAVAGTVYSVSTGATEFVEQGALLLQYADLHKERVKAYFDEPEIGSLEVGQPILIKWDARPGQSWHGHIESIPVTVINLGSRTVGEVPIAIDGADSGLLPDTNVTVTVTTSSQSDVLSIPREALYSENGKPYVFKVVGSELRRTPVTTGAYNLTQIAILSGLNNGDTIATGTTTGQPLQAGIPIRVVQ
ncbi:MAG TPA: efflux RND transporter periplasmic adaptor subunit [Terracidiphilus sp.]|nr:efflux RND transporter periplasmic adaptor subunit [Terracidiphilus sp.]